MSLTRSRLATLLGGLVLACAGAAAPVDPAPLAPGEGLRLGVFDSRAVAIAHTNSPAFQEHMADLQRQLAEARAAGDSERAAELEALGPAIQQKLHQQGFSTAPVDDLLAPFAAQLPDLAASAGVDALVSRWSLTWLAEDAPVVDMTDTLVALFEPDERTLGWIDDLRDQDPIPLEQASHLDH